MYSIMIILFLIVRTRGEKNKMVDFSKGSLRII